jgi:Na+/H+ antiporter NhaC
MSPEKRQNMETPTKSQGGNQNNGNTVTRLDFRLGHFGAAVPMVFFMIWAVTLSVLDIVTEQGLIMGGVLGLAIGMFLCRSLWKDYAQGVFEGMTQTVGVVAIVAWFWAGMFASILQAGGLVEGLVWLGFQTGVQGAMFTVVTFLLSALFATAVGTGYGTTVAFCMLMYPAGVAMGSHPIVLLGAILSGAAFGDNLAPVSDTTIVSAVTQETDIIGVVRSRFRYAIAAAIPAMIAFMIFGGGGEAQQAAVDVSALGQPEGLVLLIPFALVLVIAFKGHHLITSLTWGIISAWILILVAGLGSMRDILWFNLAEGTVEGALLDGILGYVNMAVLILLVVACGYIINLGGTMEALRQFAMSKIRGVAWRAEVAMWALVGVLNSLITINTAAEILAAPFVYDIGTSMKIHPYRRANFLDAMTSALGYIFPWAGGTLLGISTIQGLTSEYEFVSAVNPVEVVPYVFHGWFLVIVMLIAALTGFGRRYIGPNGEPVKEPPKEE